MKKIAEVGPFEIYKGAGRVAIYEGDVFFVQLFRKGNARDYRDPEAYCREVLDAREEYEADKALARRDRENRAAAYIAERKARAARQPEFVF